MPGIRTNIPTDLLAAFHIAHGCVCQFCLSSPSDAIDHIRPIHAYSLEKGTNTFFNLIPACTRCNSKKGVKLLTPDKEKYLRERAIQAMKIVVDVYDKPSKRKIARKKLDWTEEQQTGAFAKPVDWFWALKDGTRENNHNRVHAIRSVLPSSRHDIYHSQAFGLQYEGYLIFEAFERNKPLTTNSKKAFDLIFKGGRIHKDLGLYVLYEDKTIEMIKEDTLFDGKKEWKDIRYKERDYVAVPLKDIAYSASYNPFQINIYGGFKHGPMLVEFDNLQRNKLTI